MAADKRIFSSPSQAWKGGMDKDTHERFVQNGFYRDARNVSFMVDGDRFILKNVKGDTQLPYTLNTGDSMVVGAYDDHSNRVAYVLVWNSLGNHEVLKVNYDVSALNVTQVTEGEGLGFQFNNLITGIELVLGRFLIWVDDLTEPVCLDLDNLPSATITATNRYLIELAKTPDPVPVRVNFGTDPQREVNNLRSQVYKFRTRYIYNDGSRSCASTIAKVAVPDLDYTPYNGRYQTSYNNTLYISIPYIYNDIEIVSKVEVLIQSGDSDEAMGNWYILKTLDVPSTGFNPQSVVYTGIEPLTAVDNVEINQAYSFVPPTAKDVVLSPSNVLLFSNITDNIDTSSIETKVSIEQTNIAKPTGVTVSSTYPDYDNTNTSISGTFYNQQYNIKIENATYDTITVHNAVSFVPKPGDTIQLRITLNYNGSGIFSGGLTKDIDYTFTITEDDMYSLSGTPATAAINRRLLDYLNSIDTRYDGYGGVIFETDLIPSSYPTLIRIIQGENVLDSQYGVTTTVSAVKVFDQSFTSYQDADGSHKGTSFFPTSLFPELIYTTRKTFKKNAFHRFAIQYEDAKGRRTSAIPIGSFFVEDSLSLDYPRLSMYISHLAPENTVRYHILYGGNDTYDDYVQLWCNYTVSGTDIGLDVYDILTTYNDDYANFSPEYNFVKGDKARAIAVSTGTTISYLNGETYDVVKDDANSVYLNASITGASTGNFVLVEFYRPKTTVTDTLYYEIGMTGTVDSNRRHGAIDPFIDTAQGSSTPAEINLINCGDTYYKYRDPIMTITSTGSSFVESENISDFYPSKVSDIGRPSVVDELASKSIRRGTAIVHTQPIVPNTNINGLSIVLGSSIKEYDIKYGNIQKMFMRMDRELVLFFEDKVGVVGILSELVRQPNGDLNYATDALLNNLNVYNYDGGIGDNPESFSRFENTCYFVSQKNNAVCRLQPQTAITEVSQYGMKSWFNDNLDVKTNFLEDSKFIGGYDERNGCYVLSLYGYIKADSVTGDLTFPTVTFTKNNAFASNLDLSSKVEMLILSDGTDKYVQRGVLINVQDDNTALISYGAGIPIGDVFPEAWLRYRIDTLWFNEEANAWMSFLDKDPEYMTTCGVDMLSFIDGEVWMSNSDTRNSLLGTNVQSTVDVVFNIESSRMKLFQNLEQEASSPWKSNVDGDILTLSGQTSLLEEAFYTEYQPQEWSAAFRQDTSTPNRTYPLLEGYDLRDRVITVKLRKDGNTEESLESVTLQYYPSESSQ